MNDRRSLKRQLLRALVTSVILGAVLGVSLVLRNTWGWFELRVMLTTVTVAVASLCGLACDLSRTPRGSNLLPIAGLALTFVAAGMILAGMWLDLDTESYWKGTAAVSVFAVATVHVCLLSIARLASRFSWVFFVASQVIYGLAALICAIIIWEIDAGRMWRLIVIVSIVDAALTFVIPLLHRLSRTDAGTTVVTPLAERNLAEIDQEIAQLKRQISALEKLRAEVIGGAEDA